jgi:hypothetical protein
MSILTRSALDEQYESIPFGNGDAEDHGCRAGLSDAATDPVDVGSDAPVEDFHDSGAEIDAMRAEMETVRSRVLSAANAIGAFEVRVKREWNLSEYGLDSLWSVFVFFPGVDGIDRCVGGFGVDLAAAELEALLKASLVDVAAKAGRAAKGATTA